jgi:hypothetical protein
VKHTIRILPWILGIAVATAPLSAGLILNTTPNLTLTEAAFFNGVLGTFTDTNSAQPASNFSVNINWGDSTTSTGTVSGGAGAFTINGSHIYADSGIYTIGLSITDTDTETALGSGTATISDLPLSLISSLSSFGFTPGNPVNLTLGHFGDGNSFGFAGEFTGVINWGDGSTSTPTIAGNPSDYAVSGSHTYLTGGPFTVTTNISDGGASMLAFQTSSVPEPGTLPTVLGALGLLALTGCGRMRATGPRGAK